MSAHRNLTSGSCSPPESTPVMTSRSGQPFLNNRPYYLYILNNEVGHARNTVLSSWEIQIPTQHNSNGILISLSVFACLTFVSSRQTDRPSYIDSNKPYLCLAYRCGLEMYKSLGKMTVMGLCDIQNRNSNKKQEKNKR